MQIDTGTIAPDFQTEDIFGEPIRLKDYAGQTVLLSFFRNAACALCNLRVHQLIQRYPDFQAKGLKILAIFESPKENILQYVGKQDAPFPIIADPKGELYELYGVEISESKVALTINRAESQEVINEAVAQGFALIREANSNFNRIPADFLIGPDQKIIHARYGQFINDHLPFEMIEQALAAGATANG